MCQMVPRFWFLMSSGSKKMEPRWAGLIEAKPHTDRKCGQRFHPPLYKIPSSLNFESAFHVFPVYGTCPIQSTILRLTEKVMKLLRILKCQCKLIQIWFCTCIWNVWKLRVVKLPAMQAYRQPVTGNSPTPNPTTCSLNPACPQLPKLLPGLDDSGFRASGGVIQISLNPFRAVNGYLIQKPQFLRNLQF
jgi:hypothetical protein